MLKVHSCKSENLSVDSPTYDIWSYIVLSVGFTIMCIINRDGSEIMEKWNNFLSK